MMRRIDIAVVFGTTVLVGMMTMVSFFFAFGKDEGTLGNGFVKNLVADSFHVFRFPNHVLFWEFFSSSGWLYLSGLMLNCLFYGLLIERIIHFIKKFASRRCDPEIFSNID